MSSLLRCVRVGQGKGGRTLQQRPSFVGIEDPELAAKIEAASQVTVIGTIAGRLEDSTAKPLQSETEVAVEAATKLSADGGKPVCPKPNPCLPTASAQACHSQLSCAPPNIVPGKALVHLQVLCWGLRQYLI